MPASPEATREIPLQELQARFVREVLYRQAPELHSQVVANGLGAERRIAIYRTNARETFALALEAAFPVLLACVGGEEFRRLAWAYQQACPSPAGNLYHLGARLPGFLAGHLRGTGDEYQVDVARLEWAVQEALVASDTSAAVDLAAIAAVPAGRQGDIRFHLHPSVRLLKTDFGVFSLWESQQAGRPVTPALRAPECLLVRRLAAGVQLQRLTAIDLAWLEALQAGAGLADSAAALTEQEQDQLGALLVRWVTAGVVTDFNLNGRLDAPEAGEDPA